MKSFLKLQGDKYIWFIIFTMMILSLFPMYSASTNIVYQMNSNQTTVSFLLSNSFKTVIGLGLLFLVHRLSVKRITNIAIIVFIISICLLIFLFFQGLLGSGVNAKRWIRLIGGFSIQPSSFAWYSLMVLLSAYLSSKDLNSKKSDYTLWGLIFFVVGLIFTSNLSTAILVYLSSTFLLFIGNYPIKKIFFVKIGVIVMLFMGFVTVKAFPEFAPTRFKTWVSRIDRWGTKSEEEKKDTWQIDNAKYAIATGGITGLGPGKSVRRNVLPQSTSDFVFAIIIEEWGLLGGLLVLFLLFALTYRFMKLAIRSQKVKHKLIVCGLGFSIILQALINLCVAVEILPVTGQPLPFFSTGGTSILVICMALGIILSVSSEEKSNQKLKNKKSKKEKKEEENPLEPIMN